MTKRERYALRMMIDLAENAGENRPVGVRAVAERQDIAPRYLEHIASQLRRAGLVRSKQGQSGGYLLARPASAIKVGEIIEAVGGPVHMTECLEEGQDCSRAGNCRSRRMWSLIESLVHSVLEQYHLDDLVENRLPTSAAAPLPLVESR